MRPTDEAELAEALRGANGPLRVRGGGTRGVVPGAGEVLETGGISGLVLYEPGALTLVARAGMPLADVEMILAGEGQRLAFEPPDMRGLTGGEGVSTIGGVVATNAGGPRRVQAGAARDALLGVRFVDGAGTVISNGGRVMKNVTGYDLARLMAGSRGTLGVLTEVSLKVLPVPETEATLSLAGLSVAQAVAAMAAALGSPFDVTGAALAGGVTRVRIEGFAGSVRYRAGGLARLLAPFGGVEVEADPAASRALWAAVRDVVPLQGRAQVVRVSVKPSDAPALVAAVPGAEVMLDWGGGLVWVGGESVDLAALRAFCVRQGGHSTVVRGPGPVLQAESPDVAALTRGLRARFDPRGILNPGLGV